MPGGVVRTFADYFGSVMAAGRVELNKAVLGASTDIDAVRREVADDPELAKFIIAQSQIALMTASSKWNVRLDFSMDSLTAVEQVLGHLHDALKTATPQERPSEEAIKTSAIVSTPEPALG